MTSAAVSSAAEVRTASSSRSATPGWNSYSSAPPSRLRSSPPRKTSASCAGWKRSPRPAPAWWISRITGSVSGWTVASAPARRWASGEAAPRKRRSRSSAVGSGTWAVARVVTGFSAPSSSITGSGAPPAPVPVSAAHEPSSPSASSSTGTGVLPSYETSPRGSTGWRTDSARPGAPSRPQASTSSRWVGIPRSGHIRAGSGWRTATGEWRAQRRSRRGMAPPRHPGPTPSERISITVRPEVSVSWRAVRRGAPGAYGRALSTGSASRALSGP